MSKDYANNSHRRNAQRAPERRSVLLAVVACFCLLGALVVYVVHWHQASTLFSTEKEKVAAWVDHAEVVLQHKKAQPTNKSASNKSVDIAQNDEVRFDFYTELPNMQVNLPASANPKVFTSAKSVDNVTAAKMDNSIQTLLTKQPVTKQYVVQLGEFDNPLDASQMRLSLLLAGFDTQVVKTAQRKYRIQQGPYSNERQAKAMQRQLNKKGFDSVVKSLF